MGDLPVEKSIEQSIQPESEGASNQNAGENIVEQSNVTENIPQDENIPQPARTAPADDLQAKYDKASQESKYYAEYLNHIANCARTGNIEEINRIFQVQAKPAAQTESQPSALDAIGAMLSEEGGSKGKDLLTAAIKEAVTPIIASKDKEIEQYKQGLNYLMQQDGERQIRNLRENLPGFKENEGKIAEIMQKYPSISAEDAHILASHKSNEAGLKKQAVADYKEAVLQKTAPSGVNVPGDITSSVEKIPAFKDFAAAYEYTKNKVAH